MIKEKAGSSTIQDTIKYWTLQTLNEVEFYIGTYFKYKTDQEKENMLMKNVSILKH